MADWPETSNPEVLPSQVAAALAEDDWRDKIRLIDCREEDEFALCQIDGAELIPLSRFAEEGPAKLVDAGDDSRNIMVYCHHGMRSLQATQFLRQKGQASVWSMQGGIDAWSTEIDPQVPRY